jgi:hypothetical protein
VFEVRDSVKNLDARQEEDLPATRIQLEPDP